MMKEDAIHKVLEQITVPDYIKLLRQNGRENVDIETRKAFASIYSQIKAFQISYPIVSKEIKAGIQLVERIFESDWHLEAHKIPNYNTYTNLRVLNWTLGTYQRASLPSIWKQCWRAIALLSQDLLAFEERSQQQQTSWQQQRREAPVLEKRIPQLHKLLQEIPLSQLPSLDWNIETLSPNWFDYIHKKDEVLIYLTQFPQSNYHEEYLFLRTVHLGECCFWGILTAVIAAIESAKQHQLLQASQCLEQAIQFADFLIPLFQVFKTMPEDAFMDFRDATGDASAIQSRTYQLVQIFMQGIDKTKAPVMAEISGVDDLVLYANPNFISLRSTLNQIHTETEPYAQIFLEKAEALDAILYKWRCLHIGIAYRYLPKGVSGTGGSKGVPYLQSHFKNKIFPLSKATATTSTRFPFKPVAKPIISPIN